VNRLTTGVSRTVRWSDSISSTVSSLDLSVASFDRSMVPGSVPRGMLDPVQTSNAPLNIRSVPGVWSWMV